MVGRDLEGDMQEQQQQLLCKLVLVLTPQGPRYYLLDPFQMCLFAVILNDINTNILY